MQYKICHSISNKIFETKILKKYIVEYFYCIKCGFLQTENPYWLDEAYQSAINAYDTGVIIRNLQFSKIVSIILTFFFNRNGKFLDYAGGYGLFTRLMRDIGFDFYWFDRYAQNLTARGFEYTEHTGDIELITTFESFEHFLLPLEEVEYMLSIAQNILFTTVLLPSPIPRPEDWWYYAPEHGQHISFFSAKTLEVIAKKFNLNSYSFSGFHLFTEKRLNKNFLRLINRLYKLRLNKQIEPLLFSYVKRKLKSRTEEDMKYIISLMNS